MNSVNLRAMACIAKYGAHFHNGVYSLNCCTKCKIPNTDPAFYEAGVDYWRRSTLSPGTLMAWKKGKCIFQAPIATNKEVHHALCLVGYRDPLPAGK